MVITMDRDRTLKELRDAIAEADKLRTDKDTPMVERVEMERMVVELRKLERKLISDMQDEINDDLKAATDELRKRAAIIRERVSRMNVTAKTLRHFKNFFGYIEDILKLL